MKQLAIAASVIFLSTGAMAQNGAVAAETDTKGQIVVPQGKLGADRSASGGASADAVVPPGAEAGGTGAAQTGNASVQPLDEKASAEGAAKVTTE